MLLTIRENNIDDRSIKIIVDCLKNDGIIIYPTDTVYGMACDFKSKKAIEKICLLKNIKPEKAKFSFIFNDLSTISQFTKTLDTATFRLLKHNLPGAFTFILPANNNLPKILSTNRKTVGIRIPKNTIAKKIIEELGNPLFSTSLHNDQNEIVEYLTDPEEIYEIFELKVDIVIDGGIGGLEPSTIVDCNEGEIEILRIGKGILK